MTKTLVIIFLTLVCGRTYQLYSNETYQNLRNDNFYKFLVKFSKNKAFQRERILFPLVLHTENLQGKSIVKKLNVNSWKHTDFVGLGKLDKKNQIEIEAISDSEVRLIYSIEDTGVYVIHYFIKKDGKWFLYKISDQSD